MDSPPRPAAPLPPSVAQLARESSPAGDPLAAALKRHLKPDPGPSLRQRSGEAPARPKREWLAWLIGPALCAAGLTAALLVREAPDGLFPWAIGTGVVLIVGWITACALFPAKADRTCPACQGDTLERLDPGSHRGLRCSHCGFTDESASSFFLAEEEGTLEDVVLAERARRRGSRPESSVHSLDR